MRAAHPATIEAIELGAVGYAEALELQRALARERAQGLRPDALLLLEHPHVITRGAGFNGRTLSYAAHPVFDVERGGDVTYHGPGQLVGYPIVDLRERGIRVGPYLRAVEEALIQAAAALGVAAWREPGFTGVWCRGGKLASIGVAVRSWVAFHGFALNVSTDLRQFAGLYPCGLEPETLTSLERELGRAPNMGRVRREVIRAFQRTFGTTTEFEQGKRALCARLPC